jgi:glycosyltransferase involved in cell wall biosynthesis
VAFAHGCAPGIGSEVGVGWVWAQLLATIGPTIVIARSWPGDRARVADAMERIPARDRPTIVWVELPGWTRRYQRPGSPDRLQRFEYLLWQARALRVARRLHKRAPFDLAWHLVWANVWLGSVGGLMGIPFVYGPVGGGVTPPWRLVMGLGPRTIAVELLRIATRDAARLLNPLARLSWGRASLVLVQNPETRQWLPRSARGRAVVFPNAVFETQPLAHRGPPPRPRTALFAGRLVAWKGASIAVRVIARLPAWRLIVCGTGPEEARLRTLAADLGAADRVEFRGVIPRDELLEVMAREAGALLFPSLRDEGPWVTAEAAWSKLPVVSLERGGPPVLAGWGVRPGSPERTIADLALALEATVDGEIPTGWPTDFATARATLMTLLDERGLARARPDPQSRF